MQGEKIIRSAVHAGSWYTNNSTSSLTKNWSYYNNYKQISQRLKQSHNGMQKDWRQSLVLMLDFDTVDLLLLGAINIWVHLRIKMLEFSCLVLLIINSLIQWAFRCVNSWKHRLEISRLIYRVIMWLCSNKCIEEWNKW